MARQYTYLTDETGAILTDESGALIYIATYGKNPNPWRRVTAAHPKARTNWDAVDKPATDWRKAATKPRTDWNSGDKPATAWRRTANKPTTDWRDL